MKKIMEKFIVFTLVLTIISGSFVCFAGSLTNDAAKLHRGQFKKYVLLGDSVASGYRDTVSDNDDAFNKAHQETTYCRVPGSYADVLANSIIEDKSMTAFAAPGFRTVEIRYMLEDDFDEADEYLFHPAQLDAVGYAGSEEYRTAYKKAVAEADLITLGVGGNDWGAYLGWVISDIFEKENVADKYTAMLREILSGTEAGVDAIDDLVELAHVAGALPELVAAIPQALSYGLGNFYKNWDIMIQDIYELNPDVTLMVIGMSDNSLKGKYYDYDGVVGEQVNGGAEQDETSAEVTSAIVGFILGVGNRPMIEGAEKFGYTYVDTNGATYIESHPDAAGHEFIANRIIEELPHPDYYNGIKDVKPGNKYYNDIEFVLINGIMSTVSNGCFKPDEYLTKGQLAEAVNAIEGTEEETGGMLPVTVARFAHEIMHLADGEGISGVLKALSVSVTVLSDYNYNLLATVSRGEAANYFAMYCEE